MKGQWSQYVQLFALGVATVFFVHLVGPYVNRHFVNWFGSGANATPQQASPNEAHDPRSSQEPPSEQAAQIPVTGHDATQEALTQAWSYLAKQQYDATTHKQVCQALFVAYKTRGLPPQSNSSLLATIQLVNEIGVAHVIDEAKNLPPADAVKLINAFARKGHLLTKDQRARLRRASARAPHRKAAA
jgi:hypothetical protein